MPSWHGFCERSPPIPKPRKRLLWKTTSPAYPTLWEPREKTGRLRYDSAGLRELLSLPSGAEGVSLERRMIKRKREEKKGASSQVSLTGKKIYENDSSS